MSRFINYFQDYTIHISGADEFAKSIASTCAKINKGEFYESDDESKCSLYFRDADAANKAVGELWSHIGVSTDIWSKPMIEDNMITSNVDIVFP